MEKENEIVSIIVPIYNVEKYVGRCIESIVVQDYENIEIILIDDGSTDNSLEICEKYAKINNNIKLIKQKNSGVSVARNRGIEESTGKWICFVDGDDYMEKNMVSLLVNHIKKSNVDIVITPPIFEYENETKYGKIFLSEEFFDLNNKEKLELNIICRQYGNNYDNTDIGAGGPWGKIYNGDFLRGNKLKFIPGLKRMQDVIFNLYAMNKASKIEYKEIYGYHYRINNNSVCVKYNPKIFDIFFKVIKEFKNFIKDKNKNEEYYQALYLKTILMYIEGTRISIMHKDDKDKFILKTKKLKMIYEQDDICDAFKNIKFKNLNFKMKIFVISTRIRLFSLVYLMIKIFMKSKSKEQS